ncbi:NAD-dependent epimerase/dehydratase family protein [Ceratobasidium theobromae]|uniref:NAD-dependent epimerase/dehydratase family protein n=1 Tax=Ceratobasidium theobromae TaxID=1582974 RepID=A0A5N5QSY0_9AGAM|nr:NAD-dependent epimerase/dehydratase family protein [Ceratobasidium theobromae]
MKALDLARMDHFGTAGSEDRPSMSQVCVGTALDLTDAAGAVKCVHRALIGERNPHDIGQMTEPTASRYGSFPKRTRNSTLSQIPLNTSDFTYLIKTTTIYPSRVPPLLYLTLVMSLAAGSSLTSSAFLRLDPLCNPGGMNQCAKALITYLVPENGESLVANLRVADKVSVSPPTTYLGSGVRRALENPIVQYQQANLKLPAVVSKMFDPPEGQEPYSYVFDCTGELSYMREDPVQIDFTAMIAHLIGTEAARRGVKAYVRLTHPFYETSVEKTVHDEKDKLKPLGVRGTWWHETLRVLASIKDLNLVILRIGAIYGPGNNWGIITPRIALGPVYKHLGMEMKYLWSGGLRLNTIHVDDVAGGMWACAQWMAERGRAQADAEAGEELHFFNDKARCAEVAFVPPPTDVDDSDSTQQTIGQLIAGMFGVKFGFHGFFMNTLAKVDLDAMIQDINDMHVSTWFTLCQQSTPPIPPTGPISLFNEAHSFGMHSIAYSNAKFKKAIPYTLMHPLFNRKEVEDTIESFRAEGNWPNNC